MKVLGAMLLLGGAGLWCLIRRREGMLPLCVGRALLEDLAVLGYQIPEIGRASCRERVSA